MGPKPRVCKCLFVSPFCHLAGFSCQASPNKMLIEGFKTFFPHLCPNLALQLLVIIPFPELWDLKDFHNSSSSFFFSLITITVIQNIQIIHLFIFFQFVTLSFSPCNLCFLPFYQSCRAPRCSCIYSCFFCL